MASNWVLSIILCLDPNLFCKALKSSTLSCHIIVTAFFMRHGAKSKGGPKEITPRCMNRVLTKSTLWMNSGWFDTSEVSHKKAHWLVEEEMSSHLFFYKSIWAFLWLTSDVSNQPEFMQRVDLGKTLLDKIFGRIIWKSTWHFTL